jgi:transcriptional regulator with XRE-family HTH domain
MLGGQLIKEGRLRAGLSQRELARRLGTRQPVVARWERGAAEPSFDTVRRALRACGLDLLVSLAEADDSDAGLIARNLELEPRERLRDLEAMLAFERRARGAPRIGVGV